MNKSIFVICLLLIATVYTFSDSHPSRRQMEKVMRKLEREQKLHNRRQNIKPTRRNQAIRWRPLSIYFDLSSMSDDMNSQGMGERVAFYRKVFDATGKWWGGALKVNDDRSKIMPQINRYKFHYRRELSFKFERHHRPEEYDLLIRVFQCPNSGNTLATAGPILRHPDTRRPVTGQVCVIPFGDENFKRAADSVNRAVGTMVHEFGHVIAFISLQREHREKITVDHSLNAYMWTGSKVVEKAREYYNCSSLTGVPLQNNNGRVGGHWSEDHLGTELMTPSTGADPEKVSLMTQALCEDTKWYKADYTYAENYNFNKGRGCSVFREHCPSPPPCQAGRRDYVTSDYKGVGYCQQNGAGCAVERKFSNMDCMKGAKWDSRFTKYGASYGGNCVVAKGKFRIVDGGWIMSERMLSVQANCNPKMTSYTLTFKNFQMDRNGNRAGDAVVRCTEEGEEEFNNAFRYTSKVQCHDPQKFCTARFGTELQTCDDSCRKNGRCQHVNPQNRRLQAAVSPCNKAGQPITPAVFKGNAPEVPITNTNSGDQEWMCWCYRDGKRKLACGDLKEDNDGVGY